MSRTLQASVALIVAALLLGGVLFIVKHHSNPPVTLTLRVSVAPQAQCNFVLGLANSARFKYLVAKQAGLQPALTQKLSAKTIPGSPLLEATVGVLTLEEGRRCATTFVPTLQALCGRQAQLTLVDQTIQ